MKFNTTISLVDILFTLSTNNQSWHEFLNKKYIKFIKSDKNIKSNFSINIIPKNIKSIKLSKLPRNTFLLSVPDNKRRFKKIDFHIKMALGRYMLENELGILIHSCALVKNKKAYIFIGPPGSGKSTLLNNSAQLSPLNDDFSIILSKNNKFIVTGSPFHESQAIKKTTQTFPLKSMHFIHQSSTNVINKFSPTQVQKELLKNFLSHRSSKNSHNITLLNQALDICYALSTIIPAYLLGVKKGKTFWKIIK